MTVASFHWSCFVYRDYTCTCNLLCVWFIEIFFTYLNESIHATLATWVLAVINHLIQVLTCTIIYLWSAVEWEAIQRPFRLRKFKVHTEMNHNVGILRIFPGITPITVSCVATPPYLGIGPKIIQCHVFCCVNNTVQLVLLICTCDWHVTCKLTCDL